jgi:hypothetical protein
VGHGAQDQERWKMRNRWMFSLVATAVVALGVFGGTVLAQDTGSDSGTSDGGSTTEQAAEATGGILERVAGKLGITEEDLRAAFDEARAEVMAERIAVRIEALVEAGKLTEAEGQELLDWYESRPRVLEGRNGLRGFGGHGHHMFRSRSGGFHHLGPHDGPTETVPSGDSTSA